jgi:hypothetical protein
MARARHKSRGADAASIPLACEVCRERPAANLVVDLIFACDPCAKRISTALWHGGQERVIGGESFSSDRETNPWVY